jgi:hypothetical protein
MEDSFTKPKEKVLKELKVDDKSGLSREEALNRLDEYGLNG